MDDGLEQNIQELNSHQLGCKLFYLAHWFELNTQDIWNLFRQSREQLEEVLALLCRIEETFDADTNEEIEIWCREANAALDGRTPSSALKSGDLKALHEAIRQIH